LFNELINLWNTLREKLQPTRVLADRNLTRYLTVNRDIGMSASPWIIDVDPISARPSGEDEDLVKEQAQIDQVPQGLGTSGAQVPNTSPTSPRLPQREIGWNDTPWQEDIFDDNEDMQAVRTSIVTISVAFMVCLLAMSSLTIYCCNFT
jgi:hypothetical protein